MVAPLKGMRHEYSGLRGERVSQLSRIVEVAEGCPFGSLAFIDLASAGTWDLLCQHASRVGDYRSPDFDVTAAVAENTNNLADVLKVMSKRGLAGVVLTGSVFEQDEGAGDSPLRAFSPYGLSKGLTWHYYRYCCETMGFTLGKFVIPNPFGPYEEPRFCNYLIRSWIKGEVPTVRTPLYVRDNIPVDLLADAYAAFVGELPARRGQLRFGPSFYVESQGAFVARAAAELAPRLGIDCPFTLLEQKEFDEPKVRINTDRVDSAAYGWSESEAWDAEADFYRDRAGE